MIRNAGELAFFAADAIISFGSRMLALDEKRKFAIDFFRPVRSSSRHIDQLRDRAIKVATARSITRQCGDQLEPKYFADRSRIGRSWPPNMPDLSFSTGKIVVEKPALTPRDMGFLDVDLSFSRHLTELTQALLELLELFDL